MKPPGLDAFDEPCQETRIAGVFDDEAALGCEILEEIAVDPLSNRGAVVRVGRRFADKDEAKEIPVARKIIPQLIADAWQGTEILLATQQQFRRAQSSCRNHDTLGENRAWGAFDQILIVDAVAVGAVGIRIVMVATIYGNDLLDQVLSPNLCLVLVLRRKEVI